MRPGVSLGVLGYPGVSWGNQTDPFHTALLFLIGPQSWLIFQTIFDKLVSNFPFQNPCITLKEPLSCLFSLVFKRMMEICYFYQLFLANTWCAEIANGGHIL